MFRLQTLISWLLSWYQNDKWIICIHVEDESQNQSVQKWAWRRKKNEERKTHARFVKLCWSNKIVFSMGERYLNAIWNICFIWNVIGSNYKKCFSILIRKWSCYFTKRFAATNLSILSQSFLLVDHMCLRLKTWYVILLNFNWSLIFFYPSLVHQQSILLQLFKTTLSCIKQIIYLPPQKMQFF